MKDKKEDVAVAICLNVYLWNLLPISKSWLSRKGISKTTWHFKERLMKMQPETINMLPQDIIAVGKVWTGLIFGNYLKNTNAKDMYACLSHPSCMAGNVGC